MECSRTERDLTEAIFHRSSRRQCSLEIVQSMFSLCALDTLNNAHAIVFTFPELASITKLWRKNPSELLAETPPLFVLVCHLQNAVIPKLLVLVTSNRTTLLPAITTFVFITYLSVSVASFGLPSSPWALGQHPLELTRTPTPVAYPEGAFLSPPPP